MKSDSEMEIELVIPFFTNIVSLLLHSCFVHVHCIMHTVDYDSVTIGHLSNGSLTKSRLAIYNNEIDELTISFERRPDWKTGKEIYCNSICDVKNDAYNVVLKLLPF